MRRSTMGVVLICAVLGMSCDAQGPSASASGSSSARPPIANRLSSEIAPADWNTTTIADAPTAGAAPINVILKTDLPMHYIMAMLHTLNGTKSDDAWMPVQIGVGFDLTQPDDWVKLNKNGACISPALADIDGGGASRTPQAFSLRVAGCVPGIFLDGESHVRAWESVKRRTSQITRFDKRIISTWYLAVAQEYLCDVDIGGMKRKRLCILPTKYSSTATHKYNGLRVAAPTGGYDKGRDDFVFDLQTLSKSHNGMVVNCTSVPRPPSGPNDGLKVSDLARVPWDGTATFCTVLNRKYQTPQ